MDIILFVLIRFSSKNDVALLWRKHLSRDILTFCQTQNRRLNSTNRKPHHNITKLNLKFLVILGYLNLALNNPAQVSSPGQYHSVVFL